MKASSEIQSRSLGTAELDNLKALRTLTETHVRQALEKARVEHDVILAAAMPDEFIDPLWADQFALLAEDLWSNGFDVVDDMFRVKTRVPLAPRAYLMRLVNQSIEETRGSYLDLLRALVQKHAYPTIKEPVYGEFRTGNAVQYGDVRGLLVKLGGGSVDPEVSVYGGVTTGQMMQDYLAETGINTNEKIWLYGWEEEPRRTFNGHLQMDGLVFEDWDDNGLIIAPQDYWLRRNYYAPGDHWGCACVVSPYFPNLGDPFKI